MAHQPQVVIQFNIGGTRYEVSQSLLHSYPESMLAKTVSTQWHSDNTAEIFIDRNGNRFQYVLDYLRDGKVDLPLFVSKESLLLDLKFYGIEVVKEDSIIEKMDSSYFGKSALFAKDVLRSWNRRKNILADCVTIFETFRKNDETNLNLKQLEPSGDSFKDCNEELRKVGLYVNHERKYFLKGGVVVYDVTLACPD